MNGYSNYLGGAMRKLIILIVLVVLLVGCSAATWQTVARRSFDPVTMSPGEYPY